MLWTKRRHKKIWRLHNPKSSFGPNVFVESEELADTIMAWLNQPAGLTPEMLSAAIKKLPHKTELMLTLDTGEQVLATANGSCWPGDTIHVVTAKTFYAAWTAAGEAYGPATRARIVSFRLLN